MKNKEWYTPVRFSHLTKHAGAGSIVRDKNDLLMCVTDTSRWPVEHLKKLHAVERVKRHLAISGDLMLPPQASIDSDANLKINGGAIPTYRFPNWSYCNKCNTLHYKPWASSAPDITLKIKCPSCSDGFLNQVTWCAVSSHGDLIDVPWHKICHRQSTNPNQQQCRPELNKAYLQLDLDDRGRWQIKCKKCDSKSGIELVDFKENSPRQPWRKKLHSKYGEQVLYSIMEVNDPRVFSSVVERALVIPPESNVDKNSLSYKLMQQSQQVAAIIGASRAIERRREIEKAIRLFECTEDELFESLKDVDSNKTKEGFNFESITAADMMADEFDALITEREFSIDADFVTTHYTNLWHSHLFSLSEANENNPESKLIEELVAVDRLRVIEVYKGFQRSASDADQLPELPVVPPDLTGTQGWLPAIELFGEGIFFSINQQSIAEWESQETVRLRASEIQQRYQDSNIILNEDAAPTARFILLHTLAHAFIRELESSAGYPAASLQERIYSSSEKNMAGILIYTSVPDVAGSLGGIVDQAKPNRFIRLLDSVFKKLEWCSMDPVCSDIEGQGPSWLNRAACHGCVLVPDTSCSYQNVFLDRVFIKGKFDEGILPISHFVRNNGKKNF